MSQMVQPAEVMLFRFRGRVSMESEAIRKGMAQWSSLHEVMKERIWTGKKKGE